MTGAGTKAYAAIATNGGGKRVLGGMQFTGRFRQWAAVLTVAAMLLAGAEASGQTYRQRRKEPSQPIDGLPDKLATRPTPPAEAEQGRGGEQSPAPKSSSAASSG